MGFYIKYYDKWCIVQADAIAARLEYDRRQPMSVESGLKGTMDRILAHGEPCRCSTLHVGSKHDKTPKGPRIQSPMWRTLPWRFFMSVRVRSWVIGQTGYRLLGSIHRRHSKIARSLVEDGTFALEELSETLELTSPTDSPGSHVGAHGSEKPLSEDLTSLGFDC